MISTITLHSKTTTKLIPSLMINQDSHPCNNSNFKDLNSRSIIQVSIRILILIPIVSLLLTDNPQSLSMSLHKSPSTPTTWINQIEKELQMMFKSQRIVHLGLHHTRIKASLREISSIIILLLSLIISMMNQWINPWTNLQFNLATNVTPLKSTP